MGTRMPLLLVRDSDEAIQGEAIRSATFQGGKAMTDAELDGARNDLEAQR